MLRVIQVLARRTKSNPILLGQPGVGKTAIAGGARLLFLIQLSPCLQSLCQCCQTLNPLALPNRCLVAQKHCMPCIKCGHGAEGSCSPACSTSADLSVQRAWPTP